MVIIKYLRKLWFNTTTVILISYASWMKKYKSTQMIKSIKKTTIKTAFSAYNLIILTPNNANTYIEQTIYKIVYNVP